MGYVTAVYYQTGSFAWLVIQANAYCALPLAYKEQLHQGLQPYVIPGSGLPAVVDPYGGPISVSIQWLTASSVCCWADDLIRKGLHGPT